MAYRKVPQASEDTKMILLEEAEMLLRRKLRADAALAAHLRDCLKQGFSVRELGATLALAPATVSRWSRDAPKA